MAAASGSKARVIAQESPTELFAKAVNGLFSESDELTWLCHTHDHFFEIGPSGDLNDIISLIHGKRVYEPVGRNGLYIPADDVVSLNVPLEARNAILGKKREGSSIDEFVERTTEHLYEDREQASQLSVSVAYLIPNPGLFNRVIIGLPGSTSAIVSVVLPETYNREGSHLVSGKISGEVRLSPSQLAREISAVSQTLLTYGGVRGCEGTATAPSHHLLNDYVQKYIVPSLRAFGKRVVHQREAQRT